MIIYFITKQIWKFLLILSSLIFILNENLCSNSIDSYNNSFSDPIRIQGTIICSEHGNIDLQRPAKYIIVAPEGKFESAVISNDIGYYVIYLSAKNTIDKTLTLIYYCPSIGRITEKRKFIAEEELKKTNTKIIYKFPTVYLNQPCEIIESDYYSATEYIRPPAAAKAWFSYRLPLASLSIIGASCYYLFKSKAHKAEIPDSSETKFISIKDCNAPQNLDR